MHTLKLLYSIFFYINIGLKVIHSKKKKKCYPTLCTDKQTQQLELKFWYFPTFVAASTVFHYPQKVTHHFKKVGNAPNFDKCNFLSASRALGWENIRLLSSSGVWLGDAMSSAVTTFQFNKLKTTNKIDNG